MKIAICYSGFLRTLLTTFPNINEKLVCENNVDYFLHTWENSEYDDEINFFLENAKPKAYLIDKPKPFEQHPYYYGTFSSINWEELKKVSYDKTSKISAGNHSTYPHNVLSAFYSKHQSNILRKTYSSMTGQKYDLVVSIRSDIEFNEKVNISECKPNELNISWLTRIGMDYWNHPNMINDMFAISSPEVMDWYFDCNLYFPVMYFVEDIEWIPENLLGVHIKRGEYKINKMNVSHNLIRPNGQSHDERMFTR